MINALSVDVEDWFCTRNVSTVLRFEDWPHCQPRIARNLEVILRLLEENRTRATFFVLGWIAEKFPALIQEIEKGGHEIACHGYSHRLLTSFTAMEFEEDLLKSLAAIRPCVSKTVMGFRAPSFSISPATLWALDILVRNGMRYDSSIFPLGHHPDYGIADAPRKPFQIRPNLWEFPLSTLEFFSLRIPVSGGAYFRIFPYRVTRLAFQKLNRERIPIVFYLHPWELDPEQPRVPMSRLRQFRQYHNLHKTRDRLKRLLSDFEFTTVRDVLGL
jgi:polysaccharide deacetylase family protein (PEP-CTERM system associated)